jgi:hypothetical protein
VREQLDRRETTVLKDPQARKDLPERKEFRDLPERKGTTVFKDPQGRKDLSDRRGFRDQRALPGRLGVEAARWLRRSSTLMA